MNVHSFSFNPIQISGLSAARVNRLAEQLGHLGLTVTGTDQGYSVIGQDLAGNLNHNPSTDTLTVELHQVPTVVTPGHVLGRLYDEILTTTES
jgi:hypothetical protein